MQQSTKFALTFFSAFFSALVLTLLATLAPLSQSQAQTPALTQGQTTAMISTNLGDMTFLLDEKTAPQTSRQFIALANQGWYQGKEFYRVVQGHVIQAGINDDAHPDHQKYRLNAEFSNQLSFIKGSLGMARDDDPNSGSTEFFICLSRRAHLDGKYSHFGQLIAGEAVLDKIAAVAVTEKWLDNPGGKPVAFHRPVEKVLIQSIRISTTANTAAATAQSLSTLPNSTTK